MNPFLIRTMGVVESGPAQTKIIRIASSPIPINRALCVAGNCCARLIGSDIFSHLFINNYTDNRANNKRKWRE